MILGDELRILTARRADGLAAPPAMVALPVAISNLGKFAQTNGAVGLILLIILPKRFVKWLILIR